MTEVEIRPQNRDETLALADSRWAAFVATVDALAPDQWTGPRDAAGWTVKDHVAHVTAWDQAFTERLVNGVPMQQSLQVSDAAWTAGGFDAMNEEIRQRLIDRSIDEVKANRDATWSTMRAALAGYSASDFERPCADFGLNREGHALRDVVIDDLPGHHDEHCSYIVAITVADHLGNTE